MLAYADDTAERERREAVKVVQAAIEDLEARRTRLLRRLEADEDGGSDEFTRDIKARTTEPAVQRTMQIARLRDLEAAQPVTASPELLDLIPQGKIDFDVIPEPVLRCLYEAFRLEVVYDQTTDTAECRITLTSEAIPIQCQAAQETIEAGT